MSFSKLDCNLTRSSLWNEPCFVRVVFLSFLSLKDENGFVSGTNPNLQRICNVTEKEYNESINILSSPDKDSRSKDFDGRRIEKIDGGYIVLNHEKYRLTEHMKKENHKKYMREWRSSKQSVNDCEFTKNHKRSLSVSVSVSKSVSRFKKEEKINNIYNIYPRKVGKGLALKKISASLEKIDYDVLLSRVSEYAKSVKGKDIQFIPHPATWFGQERWNDPIETRVVVTGIKHGEHKQDDDSVPRLNF